MTTLSNPPLFGTIEGLKSRDFQLFIDSFSIPVFYKDNELVYRGCNQAFEQLLAIKASDIIGKTVHEIASKELADTYHQADLSILENKETQIYQTWVSDYMGQEHEVEFRKSLIYDDTRNIIGILGVIVDVTHQNATLRSLSQEHKTAAKASETAQKIIHNISHEFRTSLNAIIGFSDLMSPTDRLPYLDVKTYQEYATEIHKSGKHLLKLVDRVLSLSQMETDARDKYFDISLDHCINDCLKVISASFPHKKYAVQLKLDTDARTLYSDEKLLYQILINLLSNAFKYSDHSLLLVIRAQLKPQGLVLSIEDDGFGIDQQDLDHIFTPFMRSKSDKIQQHDGTGLGLTIVFTAMAALNGQIDVKSTPDKGTIFTLTFPIFAHQEHQRIA